MIKGLGKKMFDSIVDNGPYSSVLDFVLRAKATPAATRKLIIVGALDSMFKEDETLIGKMQILEDALEVKSYTEKSSEYDAKLEVYRKNLEIYEKEGGKKPSKPN
jgi:DNA polymerase III alpha subunit